MLEAQYELTNYSAGPTKVIRASARVLRDGLFLSTDKPLEPETQLCVRVIAKDVRLITFCRVGSVKGRQKRLYFNALTEDDKTELQLLLELQKSNRKKNVAGRTF